MPPMRIAFGHVNSCHSYRGFVGTSPAIIPKAEGSVVAVFVVVPVAVEFVAVVVVAAEAVVVAGGISGVRGRLAVLILDGVGALVA